MRYLRDAPKESDPAISADAPFIARSNLSRSAPDGVERARLTRLYTRLDTSRLPNVAARSLIPHVKFGPSIAAGRVAILFVGLAAHYIRSIWPTRVRCIAGILRRTIFRRTGSAHLGIWRGPGLSIYPPPHPPPLPNSRNCYNRRSPQFRRAARPLRELRGRR